MNPEDIVRLSGPQDLLASLPYLVEELPSEPGLVTLIIKGGRVGAVACGSLRGADVTPTACAEEMIELALDGGCDGFLLVGFGAGSEVTRYLDAITTSALAHGMRVLEALRVHQGRYWSLMCDDIQCCPIEGKEVNPDGSAAPAEFTVRGMVPAPAAVDEEERCRRALAPYSVSGATVQEAVAAAQERIERLAQRSCSAPLEYGLETITRAVGAQAQGKGPTAVTDLVNLAVLMSDLRMRDGAWQLISKEPQAHQELWTKVTRAARPADRAAPAALTAVAAWCGDDITMARVALEEALKADPEYTMALLMRRALDWGLPAQRWIDFVDEKLSGPQD